MNDALSPIKISAVSPDDTVRIAELISLFRMMHGDSYPTPTVYDPAFWRAQIESRMASLTAQIDGRIVAHIALKLDKHDPLSMELALPLCSPGCVDQIPAITTLFADLVRRQCNRNNWRVIYSYIDSGCALSANLNQTLFTGMESVLLPNYVIAGFDSDHGSSLVSRSIFASQIFPYPIELGELDLFLPKKHRDIILKLYEPYGLQRNFDKAPLRASTSSKYRPLHLTLLPHIETVHLEIIPSLVGDVKQVAEKIKLYPNFNQFLFIDLNDPFTPDFSEELEGFGFKFCGVLPRRKGRDNLVLWNSPHAKNLEIASALVSTPRAKLLSEYCLHQDFERALKAAGQQSLNQGLNGSADLAAGKIKAGTLRKQYAEVSGRA